MTKDLAARTLDEEVRPLRTEVSEDVFERHYLEAKELISSLVLDDDFTDFLTLPAYEQVV